MDFLFRRRFVGTKVVSRKNFSYRCSSLCRRIKVEDALVILDSLFVFNRNARDIYQSFYLLLARRYTAKGTPDSSRSSPGDTPSA